MGWTEWKGVNISLGKDNQGTRDVYSSKAYLLHIRCDDKFPVASSRASGEQSVRHVSWLWVNTAGKRRLPPSISWFLAIQLFKVAKITFCVVDFRERNWEVNAKIIYVFSNT